MEQRRSGRAQAPSPKLAVADTTRCDISERQKSRYTKRAPPAKECSANTQLLALKTTMSQAYSVQRASLKMREARQPPH